LYLKFKLRNKGDHFEWVLIAIYGAVQEEEQEIFLRELIQVFNAENLPTLVGGDFNIIRSPKENNNNNRYNDR
jgi:hypothetical protein